MAMDSTNGQCSLFLCPGQHHFTLDENAVLISLLHKIGFISKKINTRETDLRYFTGDQFLNYVSYMGCAPAIQFEASEDKRDFCFIEIHHYDSAKLIHSKKQTRAPHCPVCTKPVKDWQHHSTTTAITCEICNTTSSIETFDWRKMAGYARLFVEITDIFPREAIPQQILLDKLADITSIKWQYFYSCQ
jgi:hypothetical protein